MIKKLYCLLLLSVLLNINANGQTTNNSNFNYIYQHIESEQLKDNVKLVISLPEDYTNSKEKYPVVYVLDGKWFFSQGVTSQTHFSRFKMTPNLIIVGIENAVNQRGWYTRDSKKFNQFLEKELIPSINKKFRTADERLLFGWEVSGGFVIEVLGATPHLFTGYLAASPGPLDKTFNESYQYRYEALESLLKSNKKLNVSLFFTTGKSDYPAQYGVDNLVKLLNENQLENFRWTYKKLIEETHPTTAFKTIHKGIESNFKYYPVLRFSTTEEYISNGENEYLESYYKNRKIKYNFSEERNTTDYLYSCKSIVFTAMSDENYDAFNRYINDFLPKDMLSITHYNHASMFSTFYLKNNNTKMAMMLMNYYINKFPEAARPYNILGNVYKQMGDKKNAKKYYQKAVHIGTKNADRRLSEFKTSLKQL
jgi:predicted alpha/beta superfamily hydrolase